MPVCLVSSDGNLIKVVFSRFLYEAIFLFVNKFILGDTLRLCKYSVSYPLTKLVSIGDSCLQQLCLADGDFLFPSFLLHLLIGILL